MKCKLLQSRLVSRSVFVICAAVTVGACQIQESDENIQVNGESEPPNEVMPAPPVVEPVVDRSNFLEAMAAAASAHVAGTKNNPDALADRRFSIRIRFGCAGPSSEKSGETIGWTAAADGQSIRVRAEPDLVSTGLGSLTAETLGVEAIEGFWVPRPWLWQDACPAQPDKAAAATAGQPSRTVGLAQYFTADDSRVRRRSGRAYESVVRIAAPEEMPKQGLTMVLEGRFRAWPEGQVIRCWGSGFRSPPSCVASMELDRAAIERPEDNSLLAEWRP